jgi:hypothetical protein
MCFELIETKQPFSLYFKHKMLANNMAQDLRSAKAHPLSGDQTPSNRINYFQTPSGPLRFLVLTGCRGHRSWCAVR